MWVLSKLLLRMRWSRLAHDCVRRDAPFCRLLEQQRTKVGTGPQRLGRVCAGFSDAGMPMPSTCSGAGVREAPRHEIAGCGAATGQRALWGFDRGVRLEKFGSKRSTRSRGVTGWAHVQG